METSYKVNHQKIIHGHKIELIECHYPGYGNPPSWQIDVVCENKLLMKRYLPDSERMLVEKERKIFRFFKFKQTKEELEKHLQEAKTYSRLCYHCLQPTYLTRESCSIGSEVFCENCYTFIDEYKTKLDLKHKEFEKKQHKEAHDREQKVIDEAKFIIDNSIKIIVDNYNHKDTLYFQSDKELIHMFRVEHNYYSQYEKYGIIGHQPRIALHLTISRSGWDQLCNEINSAIKSTSDIE